MQGSVLRGFGRTVLTVIGIVLLVVFGLRAAGQASSLAAVGGPGAKKASLPITTVSQLVQLADVTEGQLVHVSSGTLGSAYTSTLAATAAGGSAAVKKPHGGQLSKIQHGKALAAGRQAVTTGSKEPVNLTSATVFKQPHVR